MMAGLESTRRRGGEPRVGLGAGSAAETLAGGCYVFHESGRSADGPSNCAAGKARLLDRRQTFVAKASAGRGCSAVGHSAEENPLVADMGEPVFDFTPVFQAPNLVVGRGPIARARPRPLHLR